MDHFKCTSWKSKSFFSKMSWSGTFNIQWSWSFNRALQKADVLPILKNIQHPSAHSPNKKSFSYCQISLKRLHLVPIHVNKNTVVRFNEIKKSCRCVGWKYELPILVNKNTVVGLNEIKNTVVMHCIYIQDVYAIN